MAKKTQKEAQESKFMRNVRQIDDSIRDLITDEGSQGVIFLADETIMGENGEEIKNGGVSMWGHNAELVSALVHFMCNPKINSFFSAALKKFIHLKGGRNEILKILMDED